MAVVLKYGREPTQPSVMYSFFRAASNGHNNTYASSNTPQTHDLDGISAHSDSGAFVTLKIGQPNDTTRNTIPSKPLTRQLQSSPPLIDESVKDNIPDMDVDPNLDRRKRRRLTPATDQEVNVEQPLKENNEVLQTDANVHKQTTIDGAFGYSKDVSQMGPSATIDPAAPKTSKRGRPRKKDAHHNTASNPVFAQQLVTGPDDQSAIPQRKITPLKKKTLILHSNGKLLSSPSTESILRKDASISDNSQSHSSRNVKMKNGKLVPTLAVVLKYGRSDKSRSNTAQRIEAILATSQKKESIPNHSKSSQTHPFFLGKVKPKLQACEKASLQGEHTDNDSESTARKQEPVAWKDIKFTDSKPTIFKSLQTVRPIWPPLSIQHIGLYKPSFNRPQEAKNALSKAKLKSQVVQLLDEETLLNTITLQLKQDLLQPSSIVLPQRRHVSGSKVAAELRAFCKSPMTHDAMKSVHWNLEFGSSHFDRGEYAGPNIWPVQFSPARWSEVLQPSASTLHQWLKGLAIHNVKSSIDTNHSIKKLRGSVKKNRRKNLDELDDFIVNSEDEEELDKNSKTAILIIGPHGCGKTASIFTIANELGFEIFEIHPGMRRSAKDIFDKVGDMAHNHLVQKGTDLSRSSSVAPSDTDASVENDVDLKRATFATPFSTKTLTKQTGDGTPAQRSKREQKQSLILFEEVDLLFEDDKGFWNGVQSLIQHSKRPVILTCNDPSSIPINDLNLYDILTYNSIDHELAVDYLMYLAAAAGHILNRAALSSLYASKRHDLRASITELSLWCQMTVGSKQGGLDWMTQDLNNSSQLDESGRRLRTFSEGTFYQSLDLVPQIAPDCEAAIRYNQDALGISPLEWSDFALSDSHSRFADCESTLDALSLLADITEAQSIIDLLDDIAGPMLASVTSKICGIDGLASNRDVVTSRYIQQSSKRNPDKTSLIHALEPIMVEKPTFPPSTGRLSPSLDTGTTSVVTDIGPYIRCIVRFDQRRERHHDELFGSQGKARRTRAARAAAEGGDKANTRTERWFPKELDFNKVLSTAGAWSGWHDEQQSDVLEGDSISGALSQDGE